MCRIQWIDFAAVYTTREVLAGTFPRIALAVRSLTGQFASPVDHPGPLARIPHPPHEEREAEDSGGRRGGEDRREARRVGQKAGGERGAEGDGRHQGGAETDVGGLLFGDRRELEQDVQARDAGRGDLPITTLGAPRWAANAGRIVGCYANVRPIMKRA